MTTTIEWTDVTWNPVRGCSIVSKGCTNCYAMKQAHRFSGAGAPYEGLTKLTNGGPVWTGKVRLVPELLDAPLHWKKPRRVFVNSMSDLFHEDVPDEFIDRVFAVMALCPQHDFQILTKRPARMRAHLSHTTGHGNVLARVIHAAQAIDMPVGRDKPSGPGWPYRNVWLGVSVEDQETADERVQLLLQTPAAARFVSAEPLLAAITLQPTWLNGTPRFEIGPPTPFSSRFGTSKYIGHTPSLNWVIIGGESGPGARPCNVAWIRRIVEQCKAAGVACFVKQLGAKVRVTCDWDSLGKPMMHLPAVRMKDRKGGDPSEWPTDLRVREFPRVIP